MDLSEKRVQTLGEELLDRAQKEEARLAKEHYWENLLMDWCMAHPDLKTRIFRFIDVFPQLKSSSAVLKHIREYFPQSEDRIPQAIRAGLLLTHPSFLTKGAVTQLSRILFQKMASLFVAATDETLWTNPKTY